MRPPISALPCFLLGLASVLSAKEMPPQAARTNYVVNGWPVRATLVPEKVSVMAGEPVFFSWQLLNVGKAQLTSVSGGETARLSITVTNEAGEASPPSQVPQVLEKPREEPLLPKIPVTRSLLLSDWAEVSAPGTYTVTAKRVIQLNPKDKDWNPDILRTKSSDTQTLVTFTLRVTPADPQRLATLIDQLGAKMLSNKEPDASEAARRLAAFRDPRIVRHMVRAADTTEGWLQWNALAALSRQPGPEALDALAKKLSVTSKDFPQYGRQEDAERCAESLRGDVARLLADSPNPEAARVLLARRSDPSPEIRLGVIRYCARLNTAESRTTLQEFASRDSDPEVRRAAASALQ